MNPIIVLTEKNDTVIFTKEELIELVDNVYNAGFNDGSKIYSQSKPSIVFKQL